MVFFFVATRNRLYGKVVGTRARLFARHCSRGAGRRATRATQAEATVKRRAEDKKERHEDAVCLRVLGQTRLGDNKRIVIGGE